MVISKNDMKLLDKDIIADKIVIDLCGPEGNHHTLLAYAHRLAKRENLDEDTIVKELMNGGFKNMVRVFDKHFGEWVILER
tara:strand:- start:215 stop:457 length:243 start_codon:yes stop_codon:yes gene_type:complete